VAIREIVMRIGKMMGAEELLQIGALPARANDAPFVVADVRRLTAEVGWTQRWTLQAGLEQTIEWWRTRNHS
jgi:nucleoside-diphosphate-sugar epimerase